MTTNAMNATCAATTSVASTWAASGLIAPDRTRSGRRWRSLQGGKRGGWDDEPRDEVCDHAEHHGASDDRENHPRDANDRGVHVEIFCKAAADSSDASIGPRTDQ